MSSFYSPYKTPSRHRDKQVSFSKSSADSAETTQLQKFRSDSSMPSLLFGIRRLNIASTPRSPATTTQSTSPHIPGDYSHVRSLHRTVNKPPSSVTWAIPSSGNVGAAGDGEGCMVIFGSNTRSQRQLCGATKTLLTEIRGLSHGS